MKIDAKLFGDALRETGIDLQAAPAEIGVFATQRAAHLALIAGEPGIEEAVIAERDRVWGFAARRAVRSGDAADARAIGLIHGVLLGMAGVG